MKIRCDLCDGAEASVFCSADEAALCEGCDHRVHFANKLASKHFRFSLLHASLKESPLCDICQVLTQDPSLFLTLLSLLYC
uniref:B-box zinc finger protein 20-like n=1 Tax=Rhizophora mucronata TaxID=61149 RepID=A0A2P2ITI9_RHIMU